MSGLLEASVTCKLYEDLIRKCNEQISHKTLSPLREEGGDDDDEVDGDININSDALDKSRFQDLSRRITHCSDTDFLTALRTELQRQLDFHRKRTQQLTNIKVIRAGRPQTYFRTEYAGVIKYFHYDGENVAREIEMMKNRPPEMYIAGRDDSKMCMFLLQDMNVQDHDTLTEGEFNEFWSSHGGLPYVRPSRLARRHLFSALSKKL